MVRIGRRRLLAAAIAAGAGLATRALPGADEGAAQAAPRLDLTPQAYLPLVLGEDARPCVVHVRDGDATNWNGSGYYYNAVDQSVVNAMVQAGLEALTGRSGWPAVWAALFARAQPEGYQPGQKVAIKVNLNTSQDWLGNTCSYQGNQINALPQPVIALIAGLVAAGVQPGDVIVYDALRRLSAYLRDPLRAAYPSVRLVGSNSQVCNGVEAATFGMDPSLTVHFTHPQGLIETRQLADVLYDATYLINMPILKRHSGDTLIPVTLGFKNHLGSLDRITGSGPDDLHQHLNTNSAYYRSTYSPLVDISANPNIRDKTILVVGDGLYGGFGHSDITPVSWTTFGDAPNSLFFATDAVAIDCVMADFVVAEGRVTRAHTYDYLFCAAERGLGVCEGTRASPGGDPWRTPYGSGYSALRYVRLDL